MEIVKHEVAKDEIINLKHGKDTKKSQCWLKRPNLVCDSVL